jgi:hypothetical protein
MDLGSRFTYTFINGAETATYCLVCAEQSEEKNTIEARKSNVAVNNLMANHLLIL